MKIIKIIALVLLFTSTACAQNKKSNSAKKEKLDYSNVDYSKRSNIIKNPTKLTGD